ncbi:MAG: Exostosin family protein, partial [Parcubacteria group bacterium Gr01-1014_48]
ACKKSNLVNTHFIVRRTFSGLRRTIEVDPKVARKEYLDSITEADFVLAPKGDGNYSNRFLKTLAFGRIPVLVDTDVVLPLEDIIDYSKIVVRVPMEHVHDTPRYIREFYDALSEQEWRERQHMARKAFEEYLRQDSFFRYFFTHLQ